MKQDETRGYAKGYAAGRRRTENESVEEFRRAVFLAALPSLMAGTWTQGEKKINTIQLMADTAWGMADEAVKQERRRRGR